MTIRIGLIGTGTVGGGCIEILKQHKEEFVRHLGVELELTRVCSRNPEQAIEHGVEDIFTQDYQEVVGDPRIDIVVEVIGGTSVAKDIVVQALKAGKCVVTANKALMATHGKEIMELADEVGKELFFEASVGGGIPIIGPLKHSLIANKISSVMGIVNGTTNYMLTRMAADGMSYEEALREAQDKGFAEADPTADVDGLDAAAKIAILASIAFNSRVTLQDVPAEGIRHITPMDLAAARDMGYCVKLLAHAHRNAEGIDVRVHPTMLPVTHPLASVNGVFNAIYVVGDAVGETMFFGEGAGSGPAASAIMGDVLECARHVQAGIAPLVGCTCTDTIPHISMNELKTQY
ncbi:MAG: homoserine dehydrogenase, partial [Coriobacteriaceae bacterium]|nr:homoserine dehydrogenase [Coriobacteriaceae bacterium]